jgi:hypothetical protein
VSDERNSDRASALSRRQTLSTLGVATASVGGFVVGTESAQSHPDSSAAWQQRGPSGERVSILDFGPDPTGRNDSSAAFRRALAQLGGGQLFVPRGRYLVERLGVLGAAGQQIVGESRWKTVFATERGGGPLFHSEVAGSGTSAFHLLSDFMIDLGGSDATAVDLASINCTTIQRIHFKGGSNLVRRGTGVRFAAPLQSGAYDNAVYDCSFEYLETGVLWDSGANNNAIFNCRIINCVTGLHAAPARPVDTPRVFGGRVEGCDIGLLEGAEFGGYFSVRFEASNRADVQFTERSRHAGIWGGMTSTTRLAIVDFEKATSPSIDSGSLGYLHVEETPSRPKVSTGRHAFAGPGKAPANLPEGDYAAHFGGDLLVGDGASIAVANAETGGFIVAMAAEAANEFSIPAYDRAARAYATINFGGGPAIRPLANGVTDIGAVGRAYKATHLTDGVYVAGQRVVGKRQPPIADESGGTATAGKVNQILAALRRFGLIES